LYKKYFFFPVLSTANTTETYNLGDSCKTD
jgi:hypothetical protein